MRALVTGAAGQLGRDVVTTWSAAGDDVIAAGRTSLDIGDRDSVLGAVLDARPDVVVNCGAFTAVDACESDPERAWRDNALAARHVAEACARGGAHLVHLSTDYVFDGAKAEPYVEWDTPNPQSVYGRSKLGGELEVLWGCPGSTVVRTSWVCGAGGGNVVRTVLDLMAADPARQLAFVDDQRGSPTFTADLAPALRRLAAARLPGTFHVTNQGEATWFEFVREVLVAAGHSPDQVRPISTAELDPPRPAPRPANSVLDNAALRLSGIPLLRHYRGPLVELVSQLKSGSS
jgi:dTDP-4-dehydrorhamnose reductase